MDRVQWVRIEGLFEVADAQPVELRTAFLAEACGDDGSLREELEAMLAASGDDHALAVERLVVDREPEARDADPLLDSCLGPWRLVSVLGRGGMGTVYRAERADGQYRQEVAVKLVGSGLRDAHHVERLRTERQVLAHLIHPNVASLLDGGFAPDGTPYLVMELVDGMPITDWCGEKRLPLEGRLRLFRVVCDAVQHAHRALVVHRDLKPSNIFVSRSGTVKLLDFGIAKLLDPESWEVGSLTTRTEMRVLTPAYAAPEQRQDGRITTATDVYALGVVLYELLTGIRPGELARAARSNRHHDATVSIPAPSETLRRIARAGRNEALAHEPPVMRPVWQVTDPRRLTRRVRGDLDRIVLTALHDDPERRYASAGQLGEEIGRFLEGRAVLAQPDSVGYRARKFVGRNRLAVTAAALLVGCITAFGVLAALQARALAEQGRLAHLERDKAEQVVRVLVELFETTNPAVRPDGDRMPIRQFLEGAEERALAGLGGAPLVRAKLRQVLGLIRYERGEYTPARVAFEEALAEQRRLAGPDHPDALDSLRALGETLHGAGDDTRALPLLEESLERHRRVYGREHEKTARAELALARLVADVDLNAAGALISHVLEVRRHLLPPNHPDLAESLGALAAHSRRLGKMERSRELYQQALAVFRDAGERQHPRAVTLINQYASLLGDMNRRAEAADLLREAIAVGQRVLGPGTLTVANLVNSLAVAETSLGRHAEAERAFRETFAQHVALFGENHWRVRNIARNIGLILALQQRYAEALTWLDRAAAIRRESTTSEDAGLEGIRVQRAWIVFRLGRRAEGLDQAARGVSALERMKDSDAGHWLAHSRLLLARMLTRVARPDEAEPVARAALSWFARWGPNHPKYADAECELGRAQVLQGLTAEGRASIERCLPIYRAWGQANREIVESNERLLARVRSPDGRRPGNAASALPW